MLSTARIGVHNLQAVIPDKRTMGIAEGVMQLLSDAVHVQSDEHLLSDVLPIVGVLLYEAESAQANGCPILHPDAWRLGADWLISSLSAQPAAVFAVAADALGLLCGSSLDASQQSRAASLVLAGLATHRSSEPAQAAGLAAARALAVHTAGRQALWAAGAPEALGAALKWHSESDRVLALAEDLLDALDLQEPSTAPQWMPDAPCA